MSDLKDFKIRNGELVKYVGSGGDIVIPEGVKSIGNFVFERCTTIGNVVIPEGVTRIGSKAFFLSSITSVTVPGTVKSYGAQAFSGCNKLTTVVLPEGKGASVFKECGRLLDSEGRLIINNVLYYCPSRHGGAVVVPEGVTEIWSGAFDPSTIQSLQLPDSIQKIHEGAFVGMHIKRLLANDAILALAWDALDSKQRLELCCQMVIDDVTVEGLLLDFCIKSDKVLECVIQNDREQLLSVILDVKKIIPLDKLDKLIENSQNTSKARMVLLNYKNRNYPDEKVTEINESKVDLEFGLRERTDAEWKSIITLKPYKKGCVISAYRGEDAVIDLPAVIGGKSILAIGEKSFSPLQQQSTSIKNARKQITSIEIPKGVSDIEKWAFYGCENLSTVKLPSSIKKIDPSAFRNCPSLKNISIDDKNKVYHISGNCIINTKSKTLIYAGGVCSIPDNGSVTAIGDMAFCENNDIVDITLPDSVTSIGKEAFHNCEKLMSVTIPKGVTAIGKGTFLGCNKLTSITIPETVEKIDYFAISLRNSKNLTIHAPSGSYAEQYAKENNIPFVAE